MMRCGKLYLLGYNAVQSTGSPEFQPTAWRYIPEHKTLHNDRCKNLRSCMMQCILMEEKGTIYIKQILVVVNINITFSGM
jgi:hypothetical protein